MAHPDGSIIFTGWILMVQIASKCKPRGTLIKGNGEPHNVTSMAAKCRCPGTWLTFAINYLISNSDWLETKEVTTERHPTDAQVPDERQVGVIEGRKEWKEGKEGKTSLIVELPTGFPETEKNAIEQSFGVGTPEFISLIWNKAMGRGGRDAKEIPIRSWRHHVATEWAYQQSRDGEQASKSKLAPDDWRNSLD